MIDRSFIEQNEAARLELSRLVGRLDERAFGLAVGADWTVSTVLCHLAFWDRRVFFLLREWQRVPFEATRLSAQSIDSINYAMKVISSAVPGPAAAALAMDAARDVDSEVARIGDELIEKIVAAGLVRMLNRSLHRREHLQRISQAVAGDRAAGS